MNISYDRDKHLIYLARDNNSYFSGTSISIDELNNRQIMQLIDILEDWLIYNNN